jgi:hypothetical protein
MVRCLRVYSNGDRVKSVWDDEALAAEWAVYNETMRPGCATFISGKCYHKGYLSDERIKAIEAELAEESSEDDFIGRTD